MRAGPALVLAGIGLFAAALVASGFDGFKAPDTAKVERQPLDGATALDLGTMRVGTVKLTDRADLQLGYALGQLKQGDAPDAKRPPTWTRVGDALVLSGGPRLGLSYDSNLLVPARIGVIRGDHLDLEASGRVDRLRVEGHRVTWSGDARVLDVHLRRSGGSACDMGPGFTLGRSSIEVLRIHADEGTLQLDEFGDDARVGTLEVHAGPAVVLSGVSVGQLPRVRLMPPADAAAASAAAAATTESVRDRIAACGHG